MSRLSTIAGQPGQVPRPPLPGQPPPQQPTQQTTTTSGYHTRPVSDRGAFNAGAPTGNTNVQAVMPDMSDFQPFQDSVFEQYERTMAPELERRRARLNQDLVNRGITPGSEAYEQEMTRFMQMENDAFSTAQRSALEQALQAQGQFYDQGLGQAQINAGLRQAQIGADASRYGSLMGYNASTYGADQGRMGALERTLLGLDEEGRQFDANYGLARDQFGLTQNQADFANLMDVLGYGANAVGANNQFLNNDRSASASILANFLPQAAFSPTDVTGAYGLANQAGAANARMAGQQRNGMFGALGSLGSAFLGLNPFGF